MEYLITTKGGNVYSFATELSVDDAAALLAKQPTQSEFSASLLDAHRKDTLTRPMGLWLLKLASDLQQESKEGPYLQLLNCINQMQAKAKGRVILRCLGVTIKACTTGANEGGCYLFNAPGEYLGKLTSAGHLRGGGDDLAEALAPVASDPVAAALAYGRETGSCACCGRELSDPVSIFGGIGPVCLERLAGKAARKAMEAQFKAEQIGAAPQLVLA